MKRGMLGVLGVALLISAPAFSLTILMGIQGLLCSTPVSGHCVNPNPDGPTYPVAHWLAQFWGWNATESILLYGCLVLVLVGIFLAFLAVSDSTWLFSPSTGQGTN